MATKTPIISRAPTRIDLAGGTLDIWPIHLFLKNALTINVGIDLAAEATLEETAGKPEILLQSADQGIELRFPPEQLKEIQPHPALELHHKLLSFFMRNKSVTGQLTLKTRAKSPAGAGLGGSSTLSIAIIGALATWARGRALEPEQEGESFIEIVRDVETTVIQVPAGLQDYYGAMYGGLQCLRWGEGTHQHEWLSEDTLVKLEERLLLFYSGQSRNSGINNWALFKAFIDKDGEVRAKFNRINEATHRLEAALRKHDWKGTSAAIAEEWSVRKTLAPGITTAEIDAAFAAAQKVAPVSGKICGAGGGGCFFLFVEDPRQKEAVLQAVTATGAKALPFKAMPRGLEISGA